MTEDDRIDAQDAFEALTRGGHEVVLYAGNLKDAIDLILNAKEKGATVAVVGGNLEDHSQGDCLDGKKIAESIRKQKSDTIIIAYSRSSQKHANYGDIYIDKNPFKLTKAVTAILR